MVLGDLKASIARLELRHTGASVVCLLLSLKCNYFSDRSAEFSIEIIVWCVEIRPVVASSRNVFKAFSYLVWVSEYILCGVCLLISGCL